MKNIKTKYLHTFTFVVIVLALVRCATGVGDGCVAAQDAVSADSAAFVETDGAHGNASVTGAQNGVGVFSTLPVSHSVRREAVHPIYSVPSFKNTFPDLNDVQLEAAQRLGVPPVLDRKDAERRKSELVYIGANPYFHVDPLRESIPYLVPRASVLLQDIGRAFYDSLYVKGVPLHQIIVTSVLRSEEDVQRLRRHNLNASENSCHRFGTTVDICYNRYVTVQTEAAPRREVRNDTLKWVLSEVLRDMRECGRCYIKYEVKQGCFHLTVR